MKYKRLMISASVIILCILIGKMIYTYYSPPKEHEIYQAQRHSDDTVRIAYIGDSWALGHKNHQCLTGIMIEDSIHQPVTIDSYGISALTSKEIYHALFEVEGFKHFIERGYDYCFISAGINDANKKMSTSYYQKSMDCIIRFLLTNHIHPIILEIPDFNICQVYEIENAYDKMVRNLSMMINRLSIDCKQEYRDALNKWIQKQDYRNEVSIVRYKEWNDDYEKDLKTMYIDDQLHLNERGYQVLDSIIAKEIYKHYQQKNYDNE